MKIIDFFECDNRDYWLEQIAKTDWRSGKYLYELLKSNTFPEYRGNHYSNLLLGYVEKIVYDLGFEKIYISTKHIGLYEKYGYEFGQMMADWRGDEQRIYYKMLL